MLQSLSSLLNGDGHAAQIVLAVVVLVVLIGLLYVLYRLLFAHRLRAPSGTRARGSRLGVVDVFGLDGQRQLVIVRRDNVEHLLMIGGPNDVVVEGNIVRAATNGAVREAAKPAAAAPPPEGISSARLDPGLALPAASQPRGTKGLQQSAAQGSGLGLDTMARTAKSRAADATGNVPAAPTAAARQNGLGLSARLRKKPAANATLPNGLAPGLAAATTNTKPKASNPNVSNAAGTAAPGSLDMPPSEPNPSTSDLGYYLSPYDGRSTYAQPAPGDAQAGGQAFGPPSTDPVRPLTLIPQWTAVAQAPYPANYPVDPAGIGYQPTERPKDSIRPLVLAPQLSLPAGYGPQASSPWPQVAPYSGSQAYNGSQAAGTSPGSAPSSVPSSLAPGPSLRVYGVP